MDLILASQSPRRKELLQLLFKDFFIEPSDCEETVPETLALEERAGYLAAIKARAVAQKHPDDLVIGSDTVVICGQELLGKPKDEADARRMLRLLSGREHSVFTGVCLCFSGVEYSFTKQALVTFYPLTDPEIQAYLDCGEPFDKAGSYGIQGRGALFVKEMKGDLPTVMGFPIARVRQTLLQLSENKPELRPLVSKMVL